MSEQGNGFPKFLMSINGKQKYLSLGEAGVAFDNGHAQVEICDNALESDFSVRPITPEEKHQISEAADKHSESK